MNTTQEFTFKELTPSLMADINADLTPMLIGEPGIGKSSVVKNLANALKTKVFVLSVNQLGTKEDLTGARTIKDPKNNTYRQVFFPHADVQDAIDYAKAHPDETPILFLDEINRTTSDVTSAALALITERRLGTTKLPSNLRLVAAGNDKGNVISFDDASITRLSLYHVQPDVDSFLAAQPELNHYVKDVLTKDPKLLVDRKSADDEDFDANQSGDDDDESNGMAGFDMFEDNQFNQQAVPRTITYTSQFLNAMNFTGKHDAAEKKAFKDAVDVLSDPDENPDTLRKSLYAHAGETEFSKTVYQAIKDELMNAFQSNTNADSDEDAMNAPEFELPKPTSDTLKKLNESKDRDEIKNVLDGLTAKEYQDLFLYMVTTEGQNAVTQPVLNAVLDSLNTVLKDKAAEVEDEADKISDPKDQKEFKAENSIDGLDKDHTRLFIEIITHDQIPRSKYALDQVMNMKASNAHIEKIQNIIDLFK